MSQISRPPIEQMYNAFHIDETVMVQRMLEGQVIHLWVYQHRWWDRNSTVKRDLEKKFAVKTTYNSTKQNVKIVMWLAQKSKDGPCFYGGHVCFY